MCTRFLESAPVWASLLLVLTGNGFAPAQTTGASGLPHVRHINANATSYVYRMAWADLKQSLAGKPALAIIEDPEVAAALQRIGRSGPSASDQPYDLMIRTIMTGLHQELVIAGSARVPRTQPATPADAGGAAVGCSVAIIRDSGGSFAQQLQELRAAAGAGQPSRIRIGDRTFEPLASSPECGAASEWLMSTIRDDEIHIAANRASAEWAQTRASQSLGDEPLFNSAVAPVLAGGTTKPVAVYYYDLRPTWERLGGSWDKQAWRSIDALAGACFLEGNGYRNRHYWKLGARRLGFLQKTKAAKLRLDWVRKVPANATGFATGVWDGPGMAAGITAVAMAAMGAGTGEMSRVPGMIQGLEPLLSTLGPRYLVYRMPRQYGGAPMFGFGDILPLNNTVLVTELSDPKTFQQSLKQLTPPIARVGTVTVGKHEATTLLVMYNLIYVAQIGREVLIAFNSHQLRDALQHWEQPQACLTDTPAYKAAAKRLLPDHCFELYLPPGTFSRDFYDHYVPMFEQLTVMMQGFFAMQRPGRGLEAMSAVEPLVLPRGSRIAAHVTDGTIISARDDGQGVLFDGYAPVLCTPYYVPYVDAWYRFSGSQAGLPQLVMALFFAGPG